MNFARTCVKAGFTLAVALLLAGCATTTPKVDWKSRVGNYTYDQVVLEMGPPDRSAVVSDGRMVAQWLTQRGNRQSTISRLPGSWIYTQDSLAAPDQYVTLTFDPGGKLVEYKTVYR